jgi:preprotein translocase subunit SecG
MSCCPAAVVRAGLEGGNVAVYLNIIQIIVSVALILVVLLQAKGGGLSTIFGGEGSVYRTKRGLEKTLFKFTIALSILFGVVSLLSVIIPAIL